MMNARKFKLSVSKPVDYCGPGLIGGLPPVEGGPDGRLRKLNQPFRGKVIVLERTTFTCCASVLTDADGQWLVKSAVSYGIQLLQYHNAGL